MPSGFFGGAGIGPQAIGRSGAPPDPVPVAGAEWFSDPGLEGTYTEGLCAGLSIDNAPTVAQSADVRGGSKAQSFIGHGTNHRILITLTGIATGTWLDCNVYAKRTAGTAGNVRLSVFDGSAIIGGSVIDSATYTQYRMIARDNGLSNWKLTEQTNGAADSDTIILDDVSIKFLTLSSLLSTRAYASADCDLSAAITRTAGTQAGLCARLDSASSPANFIIAYLDGASNVKVDKCVGGTYTNVISGAVTYGSTKRLRLVCSGTSVSAYYDGTQVGSTVTVSDAGIVSNVLHGKFSTYASNAFAGYVAA